jgi:hypothetical protein
MVIDFLYSLGSIPLLLIGCGLLLVLGIVGVTLTNWLIGKKMLPEEGGAVSAMIRAVPTIFAVLAAFMAIGSVTTFHKASDLVQKEAVTIGLIRHKLRFLPGEVASDIQDALKGYLTATISTEWPAMKSGNVDTSAGTYLNAIYARAGEYQLQTNVQQMALHNIMDDVDRLFEIHEERVHFAKEALPVLAWFVLVASGLLTILSVSLPKTRSLMMQCICAGCVSLSVGLTLFLIFDLDRPFRGKIVVESTPLIQQLQDITRS